MLPLRVEPQPDLPRCFLTKALQAASAELLEQVCPVVDVCL